ncbi:2-octaprenyl-6-methoxyphenyl hydroxylase [Vibrio agarivorans]|uniref:2-octaprenyl-6-methoxyphenyl hydroxylase n=1 Tax=Vibrio agarivorans TaxID=153622 RepID=UPI0025B5628F|nr:2-octaprenyl-6-methoxyphenyl hydroxylase [Vibrio agarivorans]MDN3661604.1 2-octaprenyl-6-methoxyphenyl hydroxylase [Vibrio agarivorans]
MKQYDVIISGGAMAGATLALALDQKTSGALSIAVVEAYKTDHAQHPGFDARAIALSHGTVEILKQFELWEDIQGVATAIEHIHVSDRGHAGMTEIACDDLAVSALGYVVELADVGRIYDQRIQANDNIDLLCPDSIVDLRRFEDRVEVKLNSQKALSAKLIVAADGAFSPCCDAINLPQEQTDFEQVAVIANVICQEAHQGRAFERFTATGPVALLPMSDDRMSLVWCLPPDEADEVLKLPDSEFLHRLQSSFGWRLGAITAAGERSSYPLILRYRPQIISHRFAVVGNAAQALHPIAGQGFNLGIRDVASLVEELAHQVADLGQYRGLSRYQARRREDRTATIELTSSLVRLFSNDWWPTRLGRNAGLFCADVLPPPKQPLLNRTLGLVKR